MLATSQTQHLTLTHLSYGIFKYRKYSLTESRVAVIGSINEK